MTVDPAVLRAVHVAGVVLWIGGVSFVTTILLPAIRREHPAPQRLAAFHRIERSFAWQARFTVLITGLSGLGLVQAFDLWDRFRQPATYWWMHAMVLVWLLFSLMLYVIEPLILDRLLARARPGLAFNAVQALHWVLLGLSLATTAGVVAGAHGFG